MTVAHGPDSAAAFIDKVVDIPVRGQTWRCLRFSHRQNSMTIVRRKGCILAHFAPFFGLTRKGLSPGLRGFFEPSTMKSSSSSRAPRGWR